MLQVPGELLKTNPVGACVSLCAAPAAYGVAPLVQSNATSTTYGVVAVPPASWL